MIPIMMYLSEDDVKAWHSFSNFTLQVWMMVIVTIHHIVRYQHVKLWSKILISLHDVHISSTHFKYFSKYCISSHGKISTRKITMQVFLFDILTRYKQGIMQINHSICSYISWWCKHGIIIASVFIASIHIFLPLCHQQKAW